MMVAETITTEITRATLADLQYIEHLRRQESESIGFIPIQRYEMEINGERHGSIYVAKENGQHVGFINATHNRAGVTRVQQVAVHEDARKLWRGKLLVEAIQKPTDWLLSCRCAADLESTKFWEALGWEHQDIVPPKSVYGRGKDKTIQAIRRQREIHRFQKTVSGLWVP